MSNCNFLILAKSDTGFELLKLMLGNNQSFNTFIISETTTDDNFTSSTAPTAYLLNVNISNSNDQFMSWITSNMDNPIIILDQENFSWESFEIGNNIYKGNLEQCFKEIENIIHSFPPYINNDSLGDYSTVSLKDLIYFSPLDSDVYIELTTGRKLKIFSCGDNLTEKDISKYKNKHINKLHFKTVELKKSIPTISDNLSKLKEIKPIIKDQLPKQDEQENPLLNSLKFDFPFNLKSSQIITLREITKDIFKTSFSHGKMKKHFQLLATNNEALEYLKKRIRCLTNILISISSELKWDTKSVIERFIYASIIHDITLFGRLDLLKLQFDEECLELSEDDKKLFHAHPEEASKMALDDSSAPQKVDDILLHHHERLDGSGFPLGINKHIIGPYAAAFIMSINFTQYILDFPKWNIGEYLTIIDAEYKGGNFIKPLKALEQLCKENLNDLP